MIIYLAKSKLFNTDPAFRFAKEYGVPSSLWTEMWRRHSLLAYTNLELCEYFQIKTGRKPKPRSIRRWVIRTEIYCMARHITNMGVRAVASEYFREFEDDVIKELTKGMRFSGVQEPQNIV